MSSQYIAHRQDKEEGITDVEVRMLTILPKKVTTFKSPRRHGRYCSGGPGDDATSTQLGPGRHIDGSLYDYNVTGQLQALIGNADTKFTSLARDSKVAPVTTPMSKNCIRTRRY